MLKVSRILLAASNSTLAEVTRLCGSEPNFPKDPIEVKKIVDHVESLVPTGKNSKKYILYLCRQLFPGNGLPPGFTLTGNVDDARIKPLMYNYDKYAISGKVNADIYQYKTLESLQKAIEGIAEAPRAKLGQYTEEQKAIIAQGSQVIYSGGGWVVHKVPKGGSKACKAAARLLCDNVLHRVEWCTGRDPQATHYFGEDFYVFELNGNSEFAMETTNDSAKIFNPANTQVWETSGNAGKFSSIESAAQHLGITVDLSQISSLPKKILPVIMEVRKVDPRIARLIPAEHVVEGDTRNLDRALMAMAKNPLSLIQDLNLGFSDQRTMGKASAVMSRCIALQITFEGSLDEFDETTAVAYIELLAAAGYKTLPAPFEAYVLKLLEAA